MKEFCLKSSASPSGSLGLLLGSDGAKFSNKAMELELTCVALERAHLDDAGLFEEVEAQNIVPNLSCVLDFTSQRMHYVN